MDPCRYNIVHGDKQKVPGISPTAHVKNCVNGFLYHAVHLSAFCYFVKGGPGSTARFSSVPCLTGFSAALPWALRARQFIVRITPKKLHPAAAQGNPCQGDNMHRIREKGVNTPWLCQSLASMGYRVQKSLFSGRVRGSCHWQGAPDHETHGCRLPRTSFLANSKYYQLLRCFSYTGNCDG